MYSEKGKKQNKMVKQKKKRKIDLLFITACISTSLVLLLIGIVALLLLTAGDLSRQLKQEMTVEVILKESITDTQFSALRRSIEASPYCAACSYILVNRVCAEVVSFSFAALSSSRSLSLIS